MPYTQAIQIAIMNHVFGGVDYVRPTTLYVGLSTTTPTVTGTNITEPTNGYTRVTVTNNSTNFPTATTVSGKAVQTNGVNFVFPEATGSWGTVTHWFMSTAITGGTIVNYGALTTSRSPIASDVVRIKAGEMLLRLGPSV